MRSNIVTILMLMLVSGLSAQVRPDFFTEETNPTNSNFEVYSQKNGVNRRASLANLRKYFSAQNITGSMPLPSGNPEGMRNKMIYVTADSSIYYVDWNGVSQKINTAGTGGGGGDQIVSFFRNTDTLYLATADSMYSLVLPAAANLSLTGTSSPVTLAISTGTDVTIQNGSNIEVTANSTALTISTKYAYYTNDSAAASGGVAIGQAYKVDIGNPYGLSWGALKIRNE